MKMKESDSAVLAAKLDERLQGLVKKGGAGHGIASVESSDGSFRWAAAAEKPSPDRRLSGVLAPVLTPMKDDLRPDTEKWISLCRRLLEEGCSGLAPFGTTSEANSLGIEERMEMLEALAGSGVPPDRLLPGTGTCAFPDTVKLSARAARLGCGGVLLLPPFYYKGVSDDGLFRATAEVIERVGDPRLKVYIYNIPPVAVVGYPLPLIERLVKAYPDTVVGIKDSSGDWACQESVLKNFPGFTVFSGSEVFLLRNLRGGGAGTISALANVIPGQIRYLYDRWASQDADAIQENLCSYRSALAGKPLIPALKAIMAASTGDPGWLNLRPPLTAPGDRETREMIARFEGV